MSKLSEEEIQIQELKELDEKVNGNSKIIDTRVRRLNELLRWAKQTDKKIQLNLIQNNCNQCDAHLNGLKLVKEIEKKDKIIDKMATQMSALCTGLTVIRENFESRYCDFINSNEDCCWKTDKSCRDCIMEYFTNKVEEETNESKNNN